MKRLVLFGFAFLGFSSSALAWGPGPGEVTNDFNELRQDRESLRGDVHDLRRLEGILSNYRSASWRRDVRWLGALEQEFLGALRSEIHESYREQREKAREAWRSSVELNWNVGYNGWRDDRNDFRDDRHDLFVESTNLRALRGLEGRFMRLMGRMRHWALREKEQIIGEALRLARAELRGDLRELREDRNELREDRGVVRPAQPIIVTPQYDWRGTVHTY